jgi:hypothetical protein
MYRGVRKDALKKGSKDIEKDVQEMPGKRLRTNKRTKHSGPLSISPSPPYTSFQGPLALLISTPSPMITEVNMYQAHRDPQEI